MAGRVLLVEDNAVNLAVASAILRNLKLPFETVDNGQKAVEALTQSHYDLVLMDCQMPIMDGFEATTKIRDLEARAADGNEWRPRVPIVALTANALQGDRERCLAAGMDDYLQKPFTKVQLQAMLAKWLAGRETMAKRNSTPQHDAAKPMLSGSISAD